MATTPFLMMATRRFREEPADNSEREGPGERDTGGDEARALIVGYGRFGQTVAQILIAADIPVTLIDTDVEMIDIAGSFGAKVYFGDGTRLALLRQAGAADAELICFCIDGEQLTPDIVEAVHTAFPRAAIYARAFDRRSVIQLKPSPVKFVVREVYESAVRMGRLALEELGTSEEAIDRAEAMYRGRDKERLKLQIESGDVSTARDRIIVQAQREGR